ERSPVTTTGFPKEGVDMASRIRNVLLAGLCLAAALGVGLGLRAQDKGAAAKAGSAPRYTVVMSDGTHVVVTDNGTNRLYFYAIGPEDKVGDPLQLKGYVDLSDVGKDTLKPVDRRKKPAKSK